MKKLIAAIFVVAIFTGCNTEIKKDNQELTTRVDSLKQELQNRDQTLQAFDKSFSAIEQNLSMIGNREKEIRKNQGDLNSDTRANITTDIQVINSLLDENKKTIAKLNKSLSNYKGEVGGFKKLIAQLNQNIDDKEQQVNKLKEDLTAANFTIGMLNEMLDSTELRGELQNQMIAMQDSTLHTAYYIVSTYKQLHDMGIAEKKGDIVGIAGSKVVKNDFNRTNFIKIDTRKFTSLDLNSDKVQILTHHPKESYELTGDKDKTLVIKDPDRFWSASKYLVISIE